MTNCSFGKRFLSSYKGLCYGSLFLIALGALVRSMEAGLACPDWPLCFGKFIPDYHPEVYIEFSHRVVAALIALTTLVLNVRLLRSKDSFLVSQRMKTLCWLTFVLLFLQILVGAFTVWFKLHSHVVTTHLFLALFFFSTLFWIFWSLERNFYRFHLKKKTLNPEPSLREKSEEKYEEQISEKIIQKKLKREIWPKKINYFIFFLLILICAQSLLGGLVASQNAALVCLDFPLCHGKWFPTFSGPIGLQVLHRLGAYILTFFITMFTFIAYFSKYPRLTNLSLMLFSMLCIQIGLGIFNILLQTPAWVTVSHLVLAALMIRGTLRLLFEISTPLKKEEERSFSF